MAAMPLEAPTTPEAYLRFERAAPEKHEYHDGRIVAMTGASRAHVLITGNLSWRLNDQLVDRPCEVYANDLRVRLPSINAYVYPDLVVVCGEPRFEDDAFDTLLNPTVVVEVLSPSTERYDRAEKFAAYRAQPSIQAIALVAQDEAAVDLFERRGDAWAIERVAGLGSVLHIGALGCDVPLADVYRRVELPEGAA